MRDFSRITLCDMLHKPYQQDGVYKYINLLVRILVSPRSQSKPQAATPCKLAIVLSHMI